MTAPTILFYPNKAKTGKKTKLTPVYIRIRNGKQKTERKLDVFIAR